VLLGIFIKARFCTGFLDGVPVTINEYEDAVAEWCEHHDDPDYKWRDTD